MGIRSGYIAESRVCVDVFHGETDLTRNLAHAVSKRYQPWIDEVRCSVVDYRTATSTQTAQDAQLAAASHRNAVDDTVVSKPLVLIVDDAAVQGLAKQYGTGVQGKREVTVVATPEQAAEVAGVDVDVLVAEIERLRRELDASPDVSPA